MSLVAGVAVLGLAGTAVAAETGSLPAGVQQHAHRLFSALGVPAPRTGTTAPAPARGSSAPAHSPTTTTTPAPTTAAPATTTPGAEPAVAWCAAWRTAADGGRPMNGRDRKDLVAAAGGTDNVAAYCARIAPSATPSATVTTTKPGRSPSHKPKPSHPTPHAATPSHPGNGK